MPNKRSTHGDFRERRRAPRVAASNFVGYVCLDEEGREISEGYGYLKNQSRTGIQMETFRSVESPVILLRMAGLNDRVLETKAGRVYEYKAGEKRYVCGIRFLEPTAPANDFFI